MALLRAPSDEVPWIPGTAVVVEEDKVWKCWTPQGRELKLKTTEGQVEFSLELALKLGMLEQGQSVYGAWQLRALVPLPNNLTALIKCMVWVDVALKTGLRVRRGAIKVTWQTCVLVAPGK